MASPESLKYFAFGISAAVAIYVAISADHLWKREFFLNCLIAGGVLCGGGIAIDILRVVDTEPGIASIAMSAPIIYLGYFSIFRFFYKRMYKTEPYITSASSTTGGKPLDSFTSASREGKQRKYAKDRRITAADFGFTLVQHLAPPFTILALVLVVRFLND